MHACTKLERVVCRVRPIGFQVSPQLESATAITPPHDWLSRDNPHAELLGKWLNGWPAGHLFNHLPVLLVLLQVAGGRSINRPIAIHVTLNNHETPLHDKAKHQASQSETRHRLELVRPSRLSTVVSLVGPISPIHNSPGEEETGYGLRDWKREAQPSFPSA